MNCFNEAKADIKARTLPLNPSYTCRENRIRSTIQDISGGVLGEGRPPFLSGLFVCHDCFPCFIDRIGFIGHIRGIFSFTLRCFGKWISIFPYSFKNGGLSVFSGCQAVNRKTKADPEVPTFNT